MRTFECSYPAQVKTKAGQVVDFDPVGNAAHRRLLDRNIDEYRHTHAEAADARLDHIEADRHVAVLVDDSVSSVEKTGDTRMTIRLNATQSKPAAAPKVASQYENRYPGFKLVEFRPYESVAILERLTDKQVSVRGILANELGINPWQVQVEATGEGVWRCTLDRTVIYSPAKMDAATERACQQIGHVGWWFQADIRTGVILIHPGQPATFPKLVPFAFDRLGDTATRDRMPFAMKLARPDQQADGAVVDWTQSLGMLVAGLAGGGKHLRLDARIPVPVSDRFPDGWALNRDLRIGDLVYRRNGETIPISGFSDIEERPIYRLTLSDGQEVECSDAHLWTVSDMVQRASCADARGDERRRRTQELVQRLRKEADAVAKGARSTKYRIALDHGLSPSTTQTCAERRYLVGADGLCDVAALLRAIADERESYITSDGVWNHTMCTVLSAQQIADDPRPHGRCWGIRVADPIVNPKVALPLPPYWLGVWLGDGTAAWAEISFNREDAEIMRPWLTRGGIAEKSVVQTNPAVKNLIQVRYWTGEGSLLPVLRRLNLADNKHIPGIYRRASYGQRLSLLQGIMDSDGHIAADGGCEIDFMRERLAIDVLELVRSLGIKASMRQGEAAYVQDGKKHVTGIRYRIKFTTNRPICRLPRKLARIKPTVRSTQDWLYIVKCEPTGETAPVRCLNIATDDHLFLMDGFIPTHNSVTINDIIAMSIATGCELYVADHSTKATDFYWCRPWIHDKGWGADSLLQTLGMLRMLLDDIEEGGERARIWKEHGWQNWYDDLSDQEKQENPIRLIVVDELSQLTVGGKDATSIPKNPLPPVMERMIEQQVKNLILDTLIKLSQIGRAYGYRMIISTQIASSNTGLPPALRGNLGQKLIMGATANDAQKNLIFNNGRDVPDVPRNVIDEGVSKGAGIAEFEGQAPFVFKSAFPLAGTHAGVQALGLALADRVGLPDGVNRADYLASLDKSTPSNPAFEETLMRRIRFPQSETYARIPFLKVMQDKLDEANAEFGDGAPTVGSETEPETPTPELKPAGTGARLMDAHDLARIMEQG